MNRKYDFNPLLFIRLSTPFSIEWKDLRFSQSTILGVNYKTIIDYVSDFIFIGAPHIGKWQMGNRKWVSLFAFPPRTLRL
jgi:hypothetical protein